MSRLFIYLGRLALMILGFAVAAVAASAFLHVVSLGLFQQEGEAPPGLIAGSFLVSIPFIAMLVAHQAFLPAIVVLVVSEFLRRRDWLFYALGGAAASLPFMARVASGMPVEPNPSRIFVLAVIVGSGLIGGIAYWLVAGRSAGRWRERTVQAVPDA